MKNTAEFYIKNLNLQKHPEGGAFCEIYRADESVKAEHLPERFAGGRAFSTSIYFMLRGSEVSCFHKIKADEIWHFYDGCAVIIYVIDNNGSLIIKKNGKDILNGEMPQVVIPKNCWFGAELADKNGFALVGCTVAPGFDFEDFELAERNNMLNNYPAHRKIIEKFTKI